MKTSLAQNIRTLEISKQIEGIRVGRIVNIDEAGRIFVDYDDKPHHPISARVTHSVNSDLIMHAEKNHVEVLLAFENNDPTKPIIVDLISKSIDAVFDVEKPSMEIETPDEVLIDGKRMVFDAKEEIVLRCGKASITLTKAGKLILKGAYLLNRSSGVNKIKGASVQIN